MNTLFIFTVVVFCFVVGFAISKILRFLFRPISVKSVEEFLALVKAKKCDKVIICPASTDYYSKSFYEDGDGENRWLRFKAVRSFSRDIVFDFFLFTGDVFDTFDGQSYYRVNGRSINVVYFSLLAKRESERIKTDLPGVEVEIIGQDGRSLDDDDIEKAREIANRCSIEIGNEYLSVEDCTKAEKRRLKEAWRDGSGSCHVLLFGIAGLIVLIILVDNLPSPSQKDTSGITVSCPPTIIEENAVAVLDNQREGNPGVAGAALIIGGPFGLAAAAGALLGEDVDMLVFTTDSNEKITVDDPRLVKEYRPFVGKPLSIIYERTCKCGLYRETKCQNSLREVKEIK